MTPQDLFDSWYQRDGHWIYRNREHAMQTWRERGIDGLPAFPVHEYADSETAYGRTVSYPFSVKVF